VTFTDLRDRHGATDPIEDPGLDVLRKSLESRALVRF